MCGSAFVTLAWAAAAGERRELGGNEAAVSLLCLNLLLRSSEPSYLAILTLSFAQVCNYCTIPSRAASVTLRYVTSRGRKIPQRGQARGELSSRASRDALIFLSLAFLEHVDRIDSPPSAPQA